MRIDDGRSGRDNCRSESRVFISSPSICLICVAWVQQRQTKKKKKVVPTESSSWNGNLIATTDPTTSSWWKIYDQPVLCMAEWLGTSQANKRPVGRRKTCEKKMSGKSCTIFRYGQHFSAPIKRGEIFGSLMVYLPGLSKWAECKTFVSSFNILTSSLNLWGISFLLVSRWRRIDRTIFYRFYAKDDEFQALIS